MKTIDYCRTVARPRKILGKIQTENETESSF